jgi:hypothetical protein
MQVIENWADVTGRLTATRPHPELKGYVCASLEISDVKPVPGVANLFESARGQTIDVNVPATALPQLKAQEGGTVRLRIRKAGPSGIFTHPNLRPPG